MSNGDWEKVKTTATCFHPIVDRYFPCKQVQKCGWCGAIRFASDIGKLWRSVTKPSEEIRAPK